MLTVRCDFFAVPSPCTSLYTDEQGSPKRLCEVGAYLTLAVMPSGALSTRISAASSRTLVTALFTSGSICAVDLPQLIGMSKRDFAFEANARIVLDAIAE